MDETDMRRSGQTVRARSGTRFSSMRVQSLPNQIYLPPGIRDLLESNTELLITEGAKKALKATQEGFATIGLAGVWGWKRKDESALLPTL